MTIRNIETRIVKLEVSRRRPDEMLVIWRMPGETVRTAVSRRPSFPATARYVLNGLGPRSLYRLRSGTPTECGTPCRRSSRNI